MTMGYESEGLSMAFLHQSGQKCGLPPMEFLMNEGKLYGFIRPGYCVSLGPTVLNLLYIECGRNIRELLICPRIVGWWFIAEQSGSVI